MGRSLWLITRGIVLLVNPPKQPWEGDPQKGFVAAVLGGLSVLITICAAEQGTALKNCKRWTVTTGNNVNIVIVVWAS
jgi:hypothetical protein